MVDKGGCTMQYWSSPTLEATTGGYGALASYSTNDDVSASGDAHTTVDPLIAQPSSIDDYSC